MKKRWKASIGIFSILSVSGILTASVISCSNSSNTNISTVSTPKTMNLVPTKNESNTFVYSTSSLNNGTIANKLNPNYSLVINNPQNVKLGTLNVNDFSITCKNTHLQTALIKLLTFDSKNNTINFNFGTDWSNIVSAMNSANASFNVTLTYSVNNQLMDVTSNNITLINLVNTITVPNEVNTTLNKNTVINFTNNINNGYLQTVNNISEYAMVITSNNLTNLATSLQSTFTKIAANINDYMNNTYSLNESNYLALPSFTTISKLDYAIIVISNININNTNYITITSSNSGVINIDALN